MPIGYHFLLLLIAGLFTERLLAEMPPSTKPLLHGFQIIESQPHDRTLFTQGLVSNQQWIYASGGGYGQSRLARYDLATGKTDRQLKLPGRFFAEGITVFKHKLYILTWKAGTSLVYDAQTLRPVKQLAYNGEGWGLTHNEHELIMSNGSDQLLFLDPDTFKTLRSVTVRQQNKRWRNLNELEYAEGLIWANVWGDDRILGINPDNGNVEKIVNLATLRRQTVRVNHSNVVNGIAYDQTRRAFWVTGKNWPTRYLVQFSPLRDLPSRLQ